MMAASGREIRGKGKRDRGWAPAEERGKRERSRSRGPAVGGRGGAPRCQGWIEKTAARGSAARRKGRGGSRGPVESERARAGLERVRVRAAGGGEREERGRKRRRGRGAEGNGAGRLVPERSGGLGVWLWPVQPLQRKSSRASAQSIARTLGPEPP